MHGVFSVLQWFIHTANLLIQRVKQKIFRAVLLLWEYKAQLFISVECLTFLPLGCSSYVTLESSVSKIKQQLKGLFVLTN